MEAGRMQAAMERQTISRRTLREQVYEQLRTEIISGDLFPGEVLTLRGLSEQFDVSVVPVREALFQLSADGIVVQRTNKDYRVATLTPSEFDEIYSIRNLIEPWIAEQAFLAQPQEAKGQLEEILWCMERSENEPKEYIRCNQLFHFALYSYAEMPVLMNIISGLWARIGPYLSIHMELLVQDLDSSYWYHEMMLRSFLGGERDEFIRHLKLDIRDAYEALAPLVDVLHIDRGTNRGTNRRELIASRVLERQGKRATQGGDAIGNSFIEDAEDTRP